MEEIILNEIKSKVKRYFKHALPSHDWGHTERVYLLAAKIAKKEKANPFIVGASAYLHDTGRKKEEKSKGKKDHAEISVKIAKKILRKLEKGKINQILYCIANHRFRNGKKKGLKTIESKVLFDADKLDCIGTIGIARAYS